LPISDPPDAPESPSDFEIIIEYENHLEENLKGSLAAIEAHQDWSHALTQDIRSQWPSDTIRISFIERSPKL
jgi:hypothetical protein